MARTKKFKFAIFIFVLAAGVIGGWFAIKHAARSKVISEARKRGYEIRFSQLDLKWRKIVLHDVELCPINHSGNEGKLNVISIDLSDDFKVSAITVQGGSIHIENVPEVPTGDAGTSKKTPTHIRNISLDLEVNSTKIRATGLYADRDEIQQVDVQNMEFESRTVSGVASNIEVVKTLDGLEIQAQEVDLVHKSSPESKEGSAPIERSLPWPVHVSIDKLEIKNPDVQASSISITVPAGPVIHVSVSGLRTSTHNITATEWSGDFGIDRSKVVADVTAETIGYQHEDLSSEPIEAHVIKIHAEISKVEDQEKVSIEGKVSNAAFSAGGERGNNNWHLQFNIPDQKCADLIAAVPDGMKDTIREVSMSGSFSLSFEASRKAEEEPDVKIIMHNACKVESVPSMVSVKKLTQPFELEREDSKGNATKVKLGPGTKSWTSLNNMSQYMLLAVMTTEDPGFLTHRGFIVQAIENSIKEDIKTKKFTRGGSTISMQLAKNLWLNRGKTASRKLQEAVLTVYLEQSLSKDQIIELYLNVVEFGPGVYGIGEAARHYFNTTPQWLTLSQCLTLSLMLPSPKKAHFEADGKPSQLGLVRRILKALRAADKISDEEMATALKETPRLGKDFPDVDEVNPVQAPGWE